MQEVYMLGREIEKIRNSFILKLVYFVQANLLGRVNPSYQRYLHLEHIKRRVRKNPLSTQFLIKENELSQDFVDRLSDISSYISLFKKHVDWKALFCDQHFIIFLIQYYSTPQQKNMLGELLKDRKFKDLFEQKNSQNILSYIHEEFQKYQQSFTNDQISKINHLLRQAWGFHIFIANDLHSLVQNLSYNYDENRNINVKESLNELEEILSVLTLIDSGNSDYNDFFQLCSLFFQQKIISRTDLEFFLDMVRFLNKEDFLLNLIQYNRNDNLFRPTLDKLVYEEIVVEEGFQKLMLDVETVYHKTYEGVVEDKKILTLNKLFGSLLLQNLLKNVEQYQFNSSKKKYFVVLLVIESFCKYIYFPIIEKFVEELLNRLYFIDEDLKKSINSSRKTVDDLYTTNSNLIIKVRRVLDVSEDKKEIILDKITLFSKQFKDKFMICVQSWTSIFETLEKFIQDEQYETPKKNPDYGFMNVFLSGINKQQSYFSLLQQYLDSNF